MWNKDHSIRLSVFFTRLFLGLLALGLFVVPGIAAFFVAVTQKPPVVVTAICAAFYLCAGPAALLLWYLDRLLGSLSRGEVFTRENISRLRRISWCCGAVAVICLGAAWFFFPFLLVSAAAAFMCLILRVIKNVFQEALALKEENDFTI